MLHVELDGTTDDLLSPACHRSAESWLSSVYEAWLMRSLSYFIGEGLAGVCALLGACRSRGALETRGMLIMVSKS